jgi:hypothetical protein
MLYMEDMEYVFIIVPYHLEKLLNKSSLYY